MQELEKILEEIGELRGQAGSECTSEDHYIKKAWELCLDRVVGIIRKHMISDKDTAERVSEIFPNADIRNGIILICPRKINKNSVTSEECDESKCHDCRKEYWIAEVE